MNLKLVLALAVLYVLGVVDAAASRPNNDYFDEIPIDIVPLSASRRQIDDDLRPPIRRNNDYFDEIPIDVVPLSAIRRQYDHDDMIYPYSARRQPLQMLSRRPKIDPWHDWVPISASRRIEMVAQNPQKPSMDDPWLYDYGIPSASRRIEMLTSNRKQPLLDDHYDDGIPISASRRLEMLPKKPSLVEDHWP